MIFDIGQVGPTVIEVVIFCDNSLCDHLCEVSQNVAQNNWVNRTKFVQYIAQIFVKCTFYS